MDTITQLGTSSDKIGRLQTMLIFADYINTAWPSVLPFLMKMIPTFNGTLRLKDIHRLISENKMQLWIIHEDEEIILACLTDIQDCLSGKRICRLVGIAGEMRDNMVEMLEYIEIWARNNGCAAIEAHGREGWYKHGLKCGYEKIGITISKNLTDLRIN